MASTLLSLYLGYINPVCNDVIKGRNSDPHEDIYLADISAMQMMLHCPYYKCSTFDFAGFHRGLYSRQFTHTSYSWARYTWMNCGGSIILNDANLRTPNDTGWYQPYDHCPVVLKLPYILFTISLVPSPEWLNVQEETKPADQDDEQVQDFAAPQKGKRNLVLLNPIDGWLALHYSICDTTWLKPLDDKFDLNN